MALRVLHVLKQARSKIQMELPIGALCIDYTSHLTSIMGDPLAVLDVKASWNDHQKIYVYHNTIK